MSGFGSVGVRLIDGFGRLSDCQGGLVAYGSKYFMKQRKLTGLSRRYEAALRKHLRRGPHASLQPANSLGRRAMATGLVMLDLAKIHKRALTMLAMPTNSSPGRDGMLKRAEAFFVEAITPMEETQRAMRQANVHLSQVNETLRRRTVELAAANRRLKREILQRQAVEEALKKSEQHYSRLLQQSRRMQEQLRHLSRQLLLAQEEERKEIS